MMKLSISFLSLNLFPQLTNSETIRVEMGGGGGLGDILGAMMGGGGMMMGGGGSGPPKVEFPSGISDRIDDSFNWLVNTEWKGKSGNIVFNRDGELGGTLKACLDRRGQLKEGVCKWSANKNMVYIITPDTQKTTDKVLKFNVKGTNAYFYGPKSSEDAPTKDEKKEAKAKLDAHEEAVLKSITLESTKVAARTGKASILEFVKVVSSSEEDSLLAEDAFAVLDLLGTDENPRSPEEVTAAEIKKAYRKLSVKNHPDKGGDPVFFDKIRMSYEMLSDDDKRRYYLEGGALLVKNVETHYKEMEGMVAQQMAQLDQQIPKSHPMRAQAEAQIKAQEKSKSQLKTEIEQRLKQEEQVVEVPVSMEELFEGVESKEFHYERSVICRGCRSDSTLRNEAMCNSCGRCPPETREVPKMQGPFMVGSKTVEVESREKCRKVVQKIAGLRIPANAEDGSRISVRGNMRGKIFSHQTPGRFPGPVKLVVKRLEDKTYRSLKDDLYTVLSITPEEALFGFKKQWKLYSDASGPIVIDRIGKTTRPDEVIRVANRGMHSSSGGRGHLYVRINVGVKDYPSKALTIEEMTERKKKLDLENEEEGGAMVNTSTDLSAELEVKEENGDHWKVWDRDNEYYHKTMKRLNKMKNSEGGEKKKKSKSKEEL